MFVHLMYLLVIYHYQRKMLSNMVRMNYKRQSEQYRQLLLIMIVALHREMKTNNPEIDDMDIVLATTQLIMKGKEIDNLLGNVNVDGYYDYIKGMISYLEL